MSISLRVTGTWAELTADGSVAIPATPQVGDRMYLFARWKDFSITASVANWIEITQFADGSVSSGNGTGSVKVACWYRDWQSGDANPTIDFSASPTNASVVIMVMQKDADDVWGTPVARTAAMTNWTTSSQSVSASSTVTVSGGSVVMGLIGIRDDTATMTRPTNGIDDAAGAITWNGNYVESPATHHSTTTGDDGAADLGYRLVTTGATVTLRMTGTISAAETGAALWVVQDAAIVVTPAPASFTVSMFTPALATVVTPATANLEVTTFEPLLLSAVTPPAASLTIIAFSPQLVDAVTPSTQPLVISTFTPSLATGVTPATQSFSLITFTPTILPFNLIFLDPGGDAVQTDGYFGLAQGSGTVSFDTSQKVNGVGSWKFDSGAGAGSPYRKVVSVLPQSGRIAGYFRYNSVPDTDATFLSSAPETVMAYSGGGFTDPGGFQGFNPDDSFYARATPAKNSAQGSTLEGFLQGIPFEDAGYVIDSVKIIYERHYSTGDSIGTSRVRWVVNEEEGPNHDNTNMPTGPTVVEVDVTTDRTWTPADINSIQVIVEALRGDTDTPHEQRWDYVLLQVEYHFSVPILWGQTTFEIPILRLEVLPSGSSVVLRLIDSTGDAVLAFDGITLIPPNENHRVAVCYVIHGTNDLEIKLYIDMVEELWLVERGTGIGSLSDLLYGWISGAGQTGTSRICWFDQIYVDDVDDLSDPGVILSTNKSGASANANNFDTTDGTGAVDERPVNLANYKQQAGSSQVLQNYTLQAADVGDVDISDKDVIGYMGWAIVKKGAGTGTGAGLTVNGVTTDVTLPTSAGLLKAGVFDESYPSNAAGIGLRSIDGDADTFLYECGTIVAYRGPVEDILFAEYLLLEDQIAEVVDDLRADPPDSYTVRYWIREGGGSVKITGYFITAEGESPREWTITGSRPAGTGIARIGIRCIEMQIVMEVTEADTFVMLQHYFNL